MCGKIWLTEFDCTLINVERGGWNGWSCDGIEVEDGRVMFDAPRDAKIEALYLYANEALQRHERELEMLWDDHGRGRDDGIQSDNRRG